MKTHSRLGRQHLISHVTSVRRFIGVMMLVVASALALHATILGPIYPAPGGNMFSSSGDDLHGNAGKTLNYSGFNPSDYGNLWWTKTSIANPYDSSYNPNGTGNMAFAGLNSGVAEWDSTVNLEFMDPQTNQLISFPTRFLLAVTGATYDTTPAAPAWLVPGAFSGNGMYQGFYNNTWTPLGDLYDQFNHSCSGGCLQTSSNGGFYYTSPGQTLQFVTIPPCRVLDTRLTGNPIQGGTFQSFPIQGSQGSCEGIPTSAAAYSMNVTVVPHGPLGYLTVWPTGLKQPVVSTLNSDGRVKANAAIVSAGTGGEVSAFATNTTDLILDIDGYFVPLSQSTLAFYTLPPCRVVDTRKSKGDLGGPYLSGGVARDLPVLESSCIPKNANPAAYSFNFTALPHVPLGYLTVWPKGPSQPVVSTLNAPTGTFVANAGIVPAGTGGDIEVFATDDSDLLIDINGYFAAPAQNGLSLYPVTPCRVLDTRSGNGAFVGEMTVNVVGSACEPPNSAAAYVINATVVPSVPLGYLTLWPDGTDQPVVSTLNAVDGTITSNMAIVPTSNGEIDAYVTNPTQLIIDIFNYFGP